MIAATTLLETGVAYTDLSVEQIARKAGHGRSTFYFYFSDKSDLLLRATQDIVERLFEAWAGCLRAAVDTREALDEVLSIYRDNHALLSALVEASSYDERVREHWRELMDRFVAATEHSLRARERLNAKRETSRASMGARAFALAWMMERACYQHLSVGGVNDDEALIDALADIWERSTGDVGRDPVAALGSVRAR